MPQTYYLGNRSLFINVTAWVCIMLSTLACACGVIQQASVASWSPVLAEGLLSRPLPMMANLLMAYLPWVTGAGLIVSVALLVASGGLLMRMEWARRAFIGLLVLAIAANLVGLWLQQELLASLVDSTLRGTALPQAMAEVFGSVGTAARVLGGLMTLLTCAVMAWVMRSLMSPIVRQEFAG